MLLLVAGLAILTIGADILVRAASALALAMRISPLVVGLTIVAFGTSAPELVVSLQSSWNGQPDIAVGNVVGSNIFNVLFILGLSALITPLVVDQSLVRFDVPLLIAVSALVLLLGWDGSLGRLDGGILLAGFVGYTVLAVVRGKREAPQVLAEYADALPAPAKPNAGPLVIQLALCLLGLGLLVLGSRLFISGAVELARGLRVSELVVGLTIVAAGTSLPEVATSVVAAWKGAQDIAVGNVLGSNLFNILAVLGGAGVVADSGVPLADSTRMIDLPVMIAVAAACFPVCLTGHRIARWEGATFLVAYLAYLSYMIYG